MKTYATRTTITLEIYAKGDHETAVQMVAWKLYEKLLEHVRSSQIKFSMSGDLLGTATGKLLKPTDVLKLDITSW